MKIIYLANLYLPTQKAHGLQVMKMCQSFVQKDTELELVVAKRFNPLRHFDPFDYYNIKKRFKIKKLFSLDLIPLQKLIGRLGFFIQNLSFALLANFYLFFQKADFIYSRDPFSLFFLRFFKKNLVVEVHAFPQHFFLYKGTFKKTKAIIVITQKLKELFIEQGMPSDKILVAPDGVDLEEFNISQLQKECRQKLDLPLDKKIVLYAGHLFEWKGVYVLAQAAQYLSSYLSIVFVGGIKQDIKKLKEFIRNLPKEGAEIRILGYQLPTQIPFYLKAADVLVLPNSGQEKISQYWTSPMKMFEYMASQRPIVASDLSSIREILNNHNAVLVQPDNPFALVKGLKQILENPDFSAKIASKAFQDVQQYTWSKRAENVLEFLK